MEIESTGPVHSVAAVCPECGKQEVLNHLDGKIRHCFACGVNTPLTPRAGVPAVMDEIYKVSHRYLLESAEAHTYLTEERSLHPQVVVDSMIGLVPPDLDVTQLFMPILEEAEAELARVLAQPRKPGRPAKKEQETIDGAKRNVATLKETREQIAALEQHAGRLVFFYTNSQHQIVRVRVEPLGGGESIEHRFGHTLGVFNHGLFATGQASGSLRELRSRSIVVSSEFDLLQLQSTAARLAEMEALKPQAGYLKAAALGRTAVDVETVAAMGRMPLLIRDSSGAGTSLVAQVSQKLNLHVAVVPNDQTLDAALTGQLGDLAASQFSNNVATSRTLVTRPFKEVRSDIDHWRGLDAPKFETDRWASRELVSDLKERGEFFYDGRLAYVFEKKTNQLFPVDRDNVETQLFLTRYGIAPADSFFVPALNAMRLEGQEHGKKTSVHSLSFYNAKANLLYLFDHDRHVYRISRSRIEKVVNGTDGVLFVRNPKWKPFVIGTPTGNGQRVVEALIGSVRLKEEFLSRSDQEVLFRSFLAGMLLPQLFPTRPILAMIGEKGSGKTSVLRRLGQLLFGPDFQVMGMSNDQKDFDAAVTGDAFVAVDNADADIQWLSDKLAVVATGGTLKRRTLYTTNLLVEFPITAFVGLTSRTPHFKREDVADRLLLFNVERLEKFGAEGTLLANLVEQRDMLMTELVGELQRVLGALEMTKGKSYDINFRIADFAQFVLRTEDAEGRLDEAQKIFARLSEEQLAFTIQDDPVIELMEIWVREKGNAGREMSTAGLFTELKEREGLSQPAMRLDFKTAHGFGKYLQDHRATLRAVFGATERIAGQGRRLWKFYPPTEEVVTSDDGNGVPGLLPEKMNNAA